MWWTKYRSRGLRGGLWEEGCRSNHPWMERWWFELVSSE